MAQPPQAERIKALEGRESGPDRYALMGRRVYLCCPNGYGRTRLTNTAFEKGLATPATTRNWKTIRQLLQMAGEAI